MKPLKDKILTILPIALVVVLLLGGCLKQNQASTEQAGPEVKPSNQVVLKAYAWDNGSVYLWETMDDGPHVPYTTIPDGIHCTKVDDVSYKLSGSGETAIYYYKLNCNGKVGYVSQNQVH